ncbi:FKBP-type peptidyl-prolyl cis-trans isomerase [Flavobacterium agrisoli]|uniref:FKBP-type peptidylprolyl isomerase n=1 Tax=Flavobacterium agrisoli TaxID=2793066 RepID=A0A934ULA8_9FLAO|nr:FKBP-type peptidylprolyl isomerase [Flavobacterium agrisoli]MBK0371310.1 FKBP-type peptidylprolyl isomerase [Flavobacterium agrisoli]
MNKIKYSFIVIITVLSIISCSKKDDDEVVVTPTKPYDEQYAIDSANIEEYLKTNYITVDADYNVTFSKITDPATQPSIWSYQENTGFPKLLYREVQVHEIVYKLYYLVIREGVGENPMNVDGVLASYSGDYLTSTTTDNVLTQTTTHFETVLYPNSFMDLYGTIRGWKEVFPQFKAGNYVSNEDGTVSYDNYGVGAMFIPSGLGYYTGNGGIPAYTPLIFSFKLYSISRMDHEYSILNQTVVPDPDGVLSMHEDIDGDGYVWTASELNEGVVNPDDTDGDGVPDFLDKDDDGDNYTTKLEIKNPATGEPYPFDQIPTCDSGKKNYLDATCHP